LVIIEDISFTAPIRSVKSIMFIPTWAISRTTLTKAQPIIILTTTSHRARTRKGKERKVSPVATSMGLSRTKRLERQSRERDRV
jgi:hypothetical protein